MKKEDLLQQLKLSDPFENFVPQKRSELSSWNFDGDMLRYLLDQVEHPEVIIEVGSWQGFSAQAMASFYVEHRQHTDFTLICVDTWLGSLEHWVDPTYHKDLKFKNGRPDFYQDFLNNIHAAQLHPYILPLAMPSSQGAQFLRQADIKANLVFLDGSHDTQDVLRDVQLYWDLLEPGGLIFGDDIAWPSIQRALDVLLSRTGVECNVLRNYWWIYKNE